MDACIWFALRKLRPTTPNVPIRLKRENACRWTLPAAGGHLLFSAASKVSERPSKIGCKSGRSRSHVDTAFHSPKNSRSTGAKAIGTMSWDWPSRART